MDELRMTRSDSVRLVPDARRVIVKPFLPGEEVYPDGSSRLRLVLDRIMAMSEQVVAETLVAARKDFAGRHRDLDATLERNAGIAAARLGDIDMVDAPLSLDRLHLIGAYFTHEYSIEAAALGNPSIVPAPDQSGLEPGAVRFVMSLRAIGEGHRSSIEFRTGVIGSDASVELDPTSEYAVTGERTPRSYDKRFFATKLADMAMLNEVEERVLSRLEDEFTMAELEAAIEALDDDEIERSISGETTRVLHWLASSNYRTSFPGIDRHLRARPVPERSHREPRDGGRAIRTLHRRRRRRHVLRDLHRVRRSPDPAAAHRDGRFHALPRHHAQRPLRAQQGDGDVPAPDRRQVRGVGPTRTT